MIQNQKNAVWVFDLDDTLLTNSKLMEEMAINLDQLISKKLNLNERKAKELRDKLYKKYGSTVHGLDEEYGIPYSESLTFIHQLSYKRHITLDQKLINFLTILKGDKIVFTNGPKNHAHKSLSALAISNFMSEIISCEDFAYKFKPSHESFDVLLKSKYVTNVENKYIVDDQPQTLEIAKKLGFHVILVNNGDWNPAFELQVNTVTEIEKLLS